MSTRTSRPSSTGVAFVAAVYNYSRRLLASERGGPGMSRAEAWPRSTNRQRRSSNSQPIAAGIREHGEISGAQLTDFRGNSLSWLGVAAGVEEGGRATMTPYARLAPTNVYV